VTQNQEVCRLSTKSVVCRLSSVYQCLCARWSVEVERSWELKITILAICHQIMGITAIRLDLSLWLGLDTVRVPVLYGSLFIINVAYS
jgi:hypothetical protein